MEYIICHPKSPKLGWHYLSDDSLGLSVQNFIGAGWAVYRLPPPDSPSIRSGESTSLYPLPSTAGPASSDSNEPDCSAVAARLSELAASMDQCIKSILALITALSAQASLSP